MIVVAAASGTSLDALDLAAVELELDPAGTIELRLLADQEVPWPADLREELLAQLPPATTSMEQVCGFDQRIGQAVADAVASFVTDLPAADLVVAPGQTVFHAVADGRVTGTLQLGQPAWIAERTGLPVVSDLRARDVAAGGHGAPLVAVLDALWLGGGPARAALNLGGIANVTVVSGTSPPLAWDTGPANCLIDVAALRATGGRSSYDEGGTLALAGTVRSDLLEVLLEHPHYALTPPASTGRETFSASYLDACLARVPAVDDADLVATLTELTARTVTRALTSYAVTEVVASGGGVRNPALLAALRRHLDPTPLVTSDERGLPADAKEVVMWALLGFLTWHGLPGTVGATGAPPRILGRLTPGAEPLRMPEPAAGPVRSLTFRG